MRLYLKCMPDDYYKSIFEIDYQALKLKGIKALFFDLDNTIIDYHQTKLTHETIDLLNNLEKDFTVVIISNSGYQRVFRAVGHQFKFISFAKKPLKFGFKKALKQFDIKQAEAVMIGDQLMTDIFGAKRMKMVAILVDAVKS